VTEKHKNLYEKFLLDNNEAKFQDFHNLMSFRIRNIILVSSMYDFYLFEEDGRLYELIRKEFQGLNLSHSPELVHVSSGKEALELIKKENRFDLVITTLHVEDMTAIRLAKRLKKNGWKIPVALLGYNNDELQKVLTGKGAKEFDKIFMWQGDFRLIFGIVKYFEDKINVAFDTKHVGVQVIILIEDNVQFYSVYLPLIYREVVKQAHRLITEGINLSHRFLKMRARPKILLCSTYEEAIKYFKKYEDYILGIISDFGFPKNGEMNFQAGLYLTKYIKRKHPDLPILLQSNIAENEKDANKAGASFLYKKSPTLLEELKQFMNERFAFGDFVFRLETGEEVARASNLAQLAECLETVPEESIAYHASHNHFSTWLKARTDFWLAYQLKHKKISEYPSVDALRKDLVQAIHNYNRDRQRGIISDFDEKTFYKLSFFARIGGGSIGGKARGLGFFSSLLSNFNISNKFSEVDIFVPATVVLATDIFDMFMVENNLTNFALKCKDDSKIKKAFLDAGKFPYRAIKSLIKFLSIVQKPLAVRSSSLLEDSQGQPFAGVYETVMLPNNHESMEVKLNRLIVAIKQVYASIYYQRAKQYIEITSYHLEEEKMAVIIQEMVGEVHNNKFYPEISGVAKSYNFYPVKPMHPDDGIVSVAFGLGKTIVEGGSSVQFCPKYPKHIMQHSVVDDILEYSQKKYFAIDMNPKEGIYFDEKDIIIEEEVHEAEKDGTLYKVGSTYSFQTHSIHDGTSRDGLKLFTLAPILKYNTLPLPEILNTILKIGSWGMSNPVEIEFAMNLSVPYKTPPKFAVLQMRPLVVSSEVVDFDLERYSDAELLCKSNNVLGNGTIDDITEIIFVDINEYDRAASREVAGVIGYFNAKLTKAKKDYLLIGLGRWGTLDPWLGIPVVWEQISGAKAIVESNFKDFDVEPSQGSHFFQNMTSFKVGYFTINSHKGNGFIDWEWLKKQKVVEKRGTVYHVKTNSPITIKINGKENKGIIIKPHI
jgi:CheY-like chemotaxis protein